MLRNYDIINFAVVQLQRCTHENHQKAKKKTFIMQFQKFFQRSVENIWPLLIDFASANDLTIIRAAALFLGRRAVSACADNGVEAGVEAEVIAGMEVPNVKDVPSGFSRRALSDFCGEISIVLPASLHFCAKGRGRLQ